jgi:hypothetical protein
MLKNKSTEPHVTSASAPGNIKKDTINQLPPINLSKGLNMKPSTVSGGLKSNLPL